MLDEFAVTDQHVMTPERDVEVRIRCQGGDVAKLTAKHFQPTRRVLTIGPGVHFVEAHPGVLIDVDDPDGAPYLDPHAYAAFLVTGDGLPASLNYDDAESLIASATRVFQASVGPEFRCDALEVSVQWHRRPA